MNFRNLREKFWKILHLRSSVVTVSSYKAYCQNTRDADYRLLNLNTETDVYPVRYFGENDRCSIKSHSPEIYIAHLSETKIIGISNVVKTEKGKVLYDMLTDKKYRITDRAFIWRDKRHAEKARPFSFKGKYFLYYFNYKKVIDKAVSLVGNYSGNYYHFIFEILSKFYILEKSNIPEDYPIIIDKVVKKIPQFNELVNIFNKKRELIFVEPLEICKVKDLYWLSFVHQIPPNLWNPSKAKSDDVIFNKDALLYVREHFLLYGDVKVTKANYPSKVYIVRKSSNKRAYNEEELLNIAKDRGYVEVSPESMTFKDQAQLFYNANSIIGASGAAFSNIICCKEGCKILLLMSDRYDVTIFSSIAGLLHLDLKYLCGIPDNFNDVQTNFIIEKGKFCKYLDNV